MIPPFRAYELYTAINLHFNSKSYNFFTYQGKTNVSKESLIKRNDKYFFERFAAKCFDEEEAIGILVSNYSVKPKTYIRTLNYDVFNAWVAYRDSLQYKFKEQVSKLYDIANGINPFSIHDESSVLFDAILSGELDFETMIILDHILSGKIVSSMDEKCPENLLWEEWKKKLLTYKPFVIQYWHINDYEKELKEILKNVASKQA